MEERKISDLISRGLLVKFLNNYRDGIDYIESGTIKTIIEAQPTVNVTEVVRCKNCNMWQKEFKSGKEYLHNVGAPCEYWSNEDGFVRYTSQKIFTAMEKGKHRMKNNNFILLVGKSGSGKTTIANELYRLYGLSQIDSYTTRPPRIENEPGHIFINDEEFDSIMDDLVSYTEFNGYRYGATAKQVEENQLYVVDVDGVNYFTEMYCGNKRPIVVYITVPEQICFERICSRSGELEANCRIENDREAFKDAKDMADYIVENYDIVKCAKSIHNIWKQS